MSKRLINARLSDVDLWLIAYCEMTSNPTITTYTFKDGVEKRRPANPWAAMSASMDRFAEAARQFVFQFGESLSAAFSGFSKGDSND